MWTPDASRHVEGSGATPSSAVTIRPSELALPNQLSQSVCAKINPDGQPLSPAQGPLQPPVRLALVQRLNPNESHNGHSTHPGNGALATLELPVPQSQMTSPGAQAAGMQRKKSVRFGDAEPAAATTNPPGRFNVHAQTQKLQSNNGFNNVAVVYDARPGMMPSGNGFKKGWVGSRLGLALGRSKLGAFASRVLGGTRFFGSRAMQQQAQLENQAISDFAGTYLYAAPEVLQRKNSDFASEVFSFAILIYELFRGVPFALVYQSENDVQSHLDRIVAGWRPEIPNR